MALLTITESESCTHKLYTLQLKFCSPLFNRYNTRMWILIINEQKQDTSKQAIVACSNLWRKKSILRSTRVYEEVLRELVLNLDYY